MDDNISNNQKKSFLKTYPHLQIFIMFINSIFCGISQVMFVNNPLSGLIITIGLFIGHWQLAFFALLGTIFSTLTAYYLSFDGDLIRAGLYGYNGCLTSMGIAFFTHSNSLLHIIPFAIVLSIFSSILNQSLRRIFINHFGILPFTFSFQISTWFWLLGAIQYRYYHLNSDLFNPSLSKISFQQTQNLTYLTYSFETNLHGFFVSISQVYFIENILTSILILVAVFLSSRILGFFALFGGIIGQLIAAYLLGLPSNDIYHGLWGFNTVLTCQALGGMFLISDGFKFWLIIIFSSLFTVLIQGGLSSFGIPVLTFPFTLVCWIFCLIPPVDNIISIKLSNCQIPEEHFYRFYLSKYIFRKYPYLNQLSLLQSTINEDLTSDELNFLEKKFQNILFLTLTFRNDFGEVKVFWKKIRKNQFLYDSNLRTSLHISASQGYWNLTKWFLKNLPKQTLNQLDRFDSTPIYEAFINGHEDLVKYLRYHGGEFSSKKNEELAFYFNGFIYDNNIELIEYLIDIGINANERDFLGRYSLHIAVQMNHYHLVKYLTEHTNVSIDIKDHFNKTPYDYSSELIDKEIYNYLTEYRNLKPNRKNIIRYFTEINHDIENSLLFELEEYLLPHLFSLFNEENFDKIILFINKSSNKNLIEFHDYDFRSITHLAIINKNLQLIQYLSEYLSQSDFIQLLNRIDRWNLTSFDYMTIYNYNEINEFLNSYLLLSDSIDDHNQNNEIFDHSFTKWKHIYLIFKLTIEGNVQRIQHLIYRHYFYINYDHRTPLHFAVLH